MKINKKSYSISLIVLLFHSAITYVQAQYYYGCVYGPHESVKAVLRTNIYNNLQDTLINFMKMGYPGTVSAWFDDTGKKLFFDYEINRYFAMIDFDKNNKVVNLSRDTGGGGYNGSGYYTAYDSKINKLYLGWRKYDPSLPKGTGRIREFAEVVDPETGVTIKQMDPFFDIKNTNFNIDGSRLYAQKNPTELERRERRFYMLIVNINTDEIIEKIPFEKIVPEATAKYFPDAVGNLTLVNYVIDNGLKQKRYLVAFNYDTKKVSQKIRYDGQGDFRFSANGSNIIISEKNDDGIGHKGLIHILKVEWPENDNRVFNVSDGINVPVVPLASPSDMLIILKNDTSAFLYNNYLPNNDSSYVIRISDGKVLKGKVISP
jgi:hypothetical protein